EPPPVRRGAETDAGNSHRVVSRHAAHSAVAAAPVGARACGPGAGAVGGAAAVHARGRVEAEMKGAGPTRYASRNTSASTRAGAASSRARTTGMRRASRTVLRRA